MLWEPVDAATALRERFGFTGLDDVGAWITGVLRGTWGLDVEAVPRVVLSDQNLIAWAAPGTVVKLCRDPDRFARLDTSTRLLRALAGLGLPVADPLPDTGGRVRVVLDGPLGPLSAAVLPELDGDWLDVGDLAAVRDAGAWLARLHTALAGRATAASDLRERVAASGGADLVAGLPDLDDVPQLVHRDYRAANLLTRDSRVVGILDFDEVRVEHRVHDLAQASVFLATRFTDWGPTPPAARDALRQGYESVRPLNAAEAAWLGALVPWLERHTGF